MEQEKHNEIGASKDSKSLLESIRRIEMQQANLELEVMFQSNMAFFKQAEPSLVSAFSNYQPKSIKLTFHQSAYVSLLNELDIPTDVYPESPKTFSQEFVKKYLAKAEHYNVDIPFMDILGGDQDVHICELNAIASLLKEVKPDTQSNEAGANLHTTLTRPLPDYVPLLVVIGTGMGYSIQTLTRSRKIGQLIIVEPNSDLFFASLHTTDWAEVYSSVQSNGGELELIVGNVGQQDSGEQLSKITNIMIDHFHLHLSRIGLHYLANMYLFSDISSRETEAFKTKLFKNIPLWVGLLGYFDDERISLAHTVKNIHKNIPVFCQQPLPPDLAKDQRKTINSIELGPAFIVGNGPSLDKAQNFIKEHQPNAFIFSCGTAISALENMGVKPDYHVELERTKPTVEWLEASSTPEFRKGITLLALNTVHPEGFDLFDKRGMCLKGNDLGSLYVANTRPDGNDFVHLGLANPSVANTGLAFAIALGFKTIYLVGVDLGFPVGSQHHSSLSVYYNIKEKNVDDIYVEAFEDPNNRPLPANFGGTVMSAPLYNYTRQVIEKILRLNPEVSCCNLSDGVKIDGAIGKRYEEVEITDLCENKQVLADQLFDIRFGQVPMISQTDETKVHSSFSSYEELSLQLEDVFESSVNSISQAYALLSEHNLLFLESKKEESKQLSCALLEGSVHCFTLALSRCLSQSDEEAKTFTLFEKAIGHYQQFLRLSREKVANALLSTDERKEYLSSKLVS